MKKSTFTVALAASVLLAGASFAGGSTPLNAGKNGTKSNAGGGNGMEIVSTGSTTATTWSEPTITETKTAIGDPVVVEGTTITSQTEIGRVYLVGQDEPAGKSGNIKKFYAVTYAIVTTTSGGSVTTTYETVTVSEVIKTTTTTETFADIDPGRSQDVNKAPEGQPADEVTVVDEVIVTVSDPVVSEETVPAEPVSVPSELVTEAHVTCNPSGNCS